METGRRTKQEWSCYIILRDYKTETVKGDRNDHLVIKGQFLKKIMTTRYKLSIGVASYIKPTVIEQHTTFTRDHLGRKQIETH